MASQLPIPTQRKILKLEQQVFKLQQQVARLKEKHRHEISKLKAEIEKLRENPGISEKKRQELQAKLKEIQNEG
jgi:predicted RNase H-like nuclease (RuvC/YqgF family)